MEPNSSKELDQFLVVAVEAAKEAGGIIKIASTVERAVEHKGKNDLVTETDKQCENIILKRLTEAFPSHKFIGEETASLAGTIAPLTDEPTWIVDPLDGTSNFVHNYPAYCVSIGLTIKKIPVLGVIYNPISDSCYTAVKGGGAYLNGQRIHVTKEQDLGEVIIATELGCNREKEWVEARMKTMGDLYYKVHTLRIAGSTALALCAVAAGRVGGFYFLEYGGPWDVVAGVVIVQEAGGEVFDPAGGEFDMMSKRVAASSGPLKKPLLEALTGNV
jgi:inositol-phosphate phosphatase/L-galactose 1-phosphate phosphatase